MLAEIATRMTASQLPEAATAAAPAQLIDENASDNVAIRDDVCRRRNWLRFACARNQNCMAVAEAADANTPSTAITAAPGELKASAAANGQKTTATHCITASTFARSN
jgi:hypothetical protein